MRRVLVAVVVGTALAGGPAACSGGHATLGILTGHAYAPCAGLGGHGTGTVTVDIYTPLYQGKWQGALTRVRQMGPNSGEPVVARPTVPSGSVFRVNLAAGRYIADVGQHAHVVTVSRGLVTTADFPEACF